MKPLKYLWGVLSGVLLLAATALAQPMAGSYDLGGGAHNFATFNEAVIALNTRGVSGPVTINVFGGAYNEAVILNQVNGASAINTITFLDSSGTAHLNYTGGAMEGVLKFSGGDYYIWDGIDITAGGDTRKCVFLTNGAQYNIIRNATFTGNGFVTSTSHVIYMQATTNHYNTFSGLTLQNAYKAFHLTSYSGAGQQSRGTIIENCLMTNIRTGVYLTYMDSVVVRDNDVQLSNFGSTTDGAFGFYVDTQATNDTVLIYRNEVHNIVAVGGSIGCGLARLRSTAGHTVLYNNFCYDFQTTGNAVVRGISVESGSNYCYFNSLRVGDIAGSGAVYMVYIGASTGNQWFKNNILYNGEATNSAFGFYASQASNTPDVMDYNAFYSSGSNYNLARFGANNYADLVALQAGTAFEDHGVQGDPGFTSPTDLHILETEGLVSNAGESVPNITDDIDGNTRQGPPDIGADEYAFAAPDADFALTELLDLEPVYSELLSYTIGARIVNRGALPQTNVPFRLYYDGVQQNEMLISLTPGQTDTFYLEWVTPLAPDTGVLELQCFVAGDAVPENDSLAVPAVIVGQPMAGPYEVGGGNMDYVDFSAAVADLILRGVAGPVNLFVYGGTYTQELEIPGIVGASATNTITFRELDADDPVILTSPSSVATVRLNGADYVTFQGIDIIATGVNPRAIEITNNADNNRIRNCAIVGAGVTITSSHGIYILGGGNDNNIMDSLTVTGSYYGIRIIGASSNSDAGNEVRNCTITEGKYLIYLERQNGARVFNCDLQPGYQTSNSEVYGVYVAAHASGFQSYFYNNRIHGFRTYAGATGIYTTSGANLRAYNNSIFDFTVSGTGSVNAIRAAGGTVEFYFNSVYLNEVATTGGTSGINGFHCSGTATAATLKNNVFYIAETTSNCWAITRASGGLVSDYNCVFGEDSTGIYQAFRDSLTSYPTLATWQAATGRDMHSVSGDPGFTGPWDLHVLPTYSLLDSAATPIVGITTDCDNQSRGSVPDIGVDEYYYAPSPYNFGPVTFLNLASSYISGVPVTIRVVVQNFGSIAGSDVPVRLYYNGGLIGTQYATLPSAALDTLDFPWTPPVVGYQVGTLRAQTFLIDDGVPENDTLSAAVTIIGPPLAGPYDIGGTSPDFTGFNDALAAIQLRGIGGEITFNCHDGIYQENFTLPQLTGAAPDRRVIFRGVADNAVLRADTGAQVLRLNGADYITFEDIRITARGTCNVCVAIDGNADQNLFRNVVLTGRDSLDAATRGVKMHFLGNDYNTFDGLQISGVSYGFRMETGGSSDRSSDLDIRNCTVTGAHYGIYLDNVYRARVHGNDLQPFSHDAINCYGVYVSSLTVGDTVWVYGNRIHNLRQTYASALPLAAGIYSSPGTGAGTVAIIYNNFIYDYHVAQPRVYGMYLNSGTSQIYHNNLHINDVDTEADIAGVYLGSTLAQCALLNNVIMMAEASAACVAIWREAGVITTSDYNCLYGTGTGFITGRNQLFDGITLAGWQALGFDPHSVQGNPEFISPLDLHIVPTATLLDSAGAYLMEVTADIDGQPRANPPDIGADEYGMIITPGEVSGLTVIRDDETDDVVLRWHPGSYATSYRILAANSCRFDPNSAQLIGTTTDTTYRHVDALLDPTWTRFYVVVTVMDTRGGGGAPAPVPPALPRREERGR